LEEQEQRGIAVVFDESIDSGRGRAAEHAITARAQRRLRQIVEARMRHAQWRPDGVEQRMIANRLAIEHAG
jgi:hypothetical protein